MLKLSQDVRPIFLQIKADLYNVPVYTYNGKENFLVSTSLPILPRLRINNAISFHGKKETIS